MAERRFSLTHCGLGRPPFPFVEGRVAALEADDAAWAQRTGDVGERGWKFLCADVLDGVAGTHHQVDVTVIG